MDSSTALVSFIARAENRIEVLSTLASGSATRPGLQDETGIPRTTLSRILTDFRERDLVERQSHEYRITALGDLLATELESLFESVETMRAIQTLTRWLPLDDLGIDADRLAAADVTLPRPIEPLAPVERAAAVVAEAGDVRTFCYSVVHAPILAALRGVRTRGQRVEGVIAAGVLQVVAETPELAESARSLFQAGDVDIYIYEDGIEPQLIIADRTTMFLVTDEDGAIQGLVETDDDAILAWAESTFEALKREADPLAPEAAVELLTT